MTGQVNPRGDNGQNIRPVMTVANTGISVKTKQRKLGFDLKREDGLFLYHGPASTAAFDLSCPADFANRAVKPRRL